MRAAIDSAFPRRFGASRHCNCANVIIVGAAHPAPESIDAVTATAASVELVEH